MSTKLFIPLRPAEKQALRKRHKLPTSRWAEKERIVKKGPAPGPWRNHRNPAMAGIMDMLCQPWLRVLVIMKGVQTGATDGVFNFLGREADYSSGADSALVVLADEKSVKKHSENRLRPMIENSVSLSKLISPRPDDTTIYRIRLITGFSIEIGWATSEVSLASETYRIVVMDEYDKYRSMLNAKEAEGRTTTMEDRGKKVVKLSNPGEEGGPIDQAIQECDVISDYEVVCPDCGKKQVMQWACVRWPGQADLLTGEIVADPKRIRRERSAWYECPHCSSRWDDHKRAKALDSGVWVMRDPVDRPYSIGVWFPAWISKFVPLSEIVAKWLEAQDNPELLRSWYNKQAGLPWSSVSKEELTEAHALMARQYRWRPDGAEWIIPQAGCMLIASIDVQDNRLEAKVIAIGRGYQVWVIERKIIAGSPSSESTLVQADEFLAKTWLHESGARLSISGAGVDTGGHFTRAMYAWLRKKLSNRVFGVKGASDYRAPLTRLSFPSRKQRRQVPILMLNTTIIKNDIHEAYRNVEPGPGYIHFPDHLEQDYFEQLTSEKPIDQRDKRGNKVRYWVKKKPNIRNEALDLMVYAFGVVHHLNPDWDALERQLTPKPETRPTISQTIETVEQPQTDNIKHRETATAPEGHRSRPSWFNNRR